MAKRRDYPKEWYDEFIAENRKRNLSAVKFLAIKMGDKMRPKADPSLFLWKLQLYCGLRVRQIRDGERNRESRITNRIHRNTWWDTSEGMDARIDYRLGCRKWCY